MSVRKSDRDDINKDITHMENALLGVAEVEADILNKFKSHLDVILDSVYAHVKELKNVAAMDAMLTEAPLSQVDPGLAQGLDTISEELNQKNIEIVRLQQRLAGLGTGIEGISGESIEILRQRLDELNKRNQRLRDIQRKLVSSVIITGKKPQSIVTKGIAIEVSAKDLKETLKELDKEIKIMREKNYNLKQQIKPQLSNEQDTPTPPTRGFKRN